MKTKNLVLAAFAIVFAVGSAFSSFDVNPIYLKIKYSGDAGYTCEQITANCSNTTGQNCLIDVNLFPTGTDQGRARSASDCATILKNSSATPVVTFNATRQVEDVD